MQNLYVFKHYTQVNSVMNTWIVKLDLHIHNFNVALLQML